MRRFQQFDPWFAEEEERWPRPKAYAFIAVTSALLWAIIIQGATSLI